MRQLIEVLAVTLRSLAHEGDSQNGRSLGHERQLQTAHELIYQGLVRTEAEVDLTAAHHQLSRPDSNVKQRTRDRFAVTRFDIHRYILVGTSDMHRTVLEEIDLIEIVISTRIQTGRLHQDRRLTIELTGLESSLGDILHVQERQRVHYAAGQVIGLKHDHLVVDVLVTCVHTKTLHQCQTGTTITVVLLNDDRTLRQIRRQPPSVLQHRETHCNRNTYHEQIPVVQEGK